VVRHFSNRFFEGYKNLMKSPKITKVTLEDEAKLLFIETGLEVGLTKSKQNHSFLRKRRTGYVFIWRITDHGILIEGKGFIHLTSWKRSIRKHLNGSSHIEKYERLLKPIKNLFSTAICGQCYKIFPSLTCKH
jgi:hypothetical protein